MKLAAKLILIAFVAQAAITFAGGFLTVHHQLESFQKGREDKARELGRQFAESLAQAWQDGGRTAVRNTMDKMPLGVQYARMRWVQFNVDAQHPDAPSVAHDLLNNVVQGKVDSVIAWQRGGDGWLHTYVPVSMQDNDSCGIEMSDSLQPLQDRKSQIIRSTFGAIVGLSLISLGVAVIAGLRLVGRPLDQLIAKTKRIGQGDFSQPVVLGGRGVFGGKDELSQLGDALNDMSDQLSAQRAALESETAARMATLHQLRHADRLQTVGRLAAGVAHELGTPLNVIAGRAGLIAGGKLSDAEILRSATTIKGEADRITSIIRQLLDFARQTTLQQKPTDLRDVIARTAKLLQPLADAQQVRIDVANNEQPLVANIDEGQFQQVLTNIIMNAVQSISDGGTVTISLGTQMAISPEENGGRAEPCCLIEIADNGSGISAEHRDQLFEPFFTTKGVGEGTGLGLSIAYGIVQEHGGWIDVQSELGHGSCFTIYLPKESTQ